MQRLSSILLFIVCQLGCLDHGFAFLGSSSGNHHRVQVALFRRLSQTQFLATTTTTEQQEEGKTSETKKKKKIPIYLLAGFLGSGKTTTLKHFLENSEGVKVGVVVNDVAAVNIDAKLVNRREGGSSGVVQSNDSVGRDEIVELQNGCACCSLADELITSLETILGVQEENGEMTTTRDLDAVVVELSGVADPVAIQNNWRQAGREQQRVTNIATLSNVVTVIDACTFGVDYMTWDIARDRKGWSEEIPTEGCSSNRKVTELLAEQVEAADLILVNKIDLADPNQVEIAAGMAQNLNTKAEIVKVKWGQVSPKAILKDKLKEQDCTDPECTDTSHSHSHSHDHDDDCADPSCTDATHSHSHDHDHDCANPECTDSSHSHSHDHTTTSTTATACNDPTCTDSSHSHSHNDHACEDPDCTDTSHSHSHNHATTSTATTTDNLGISNFVYKATRPFESQRLMTLLLEWPVPIKDELDISFMKNVVKEGYLKDNEPEKFQKMKEKSPFTGVLRSKGFCWMAPTMWEGGLLEDSWRHNMAMYWSHAGKHLGIQEAGPFWVSVPRSAMEQFFVDNPKEMQRILKEDFVTEEFGDRRQELVFIGVDLKKEKIIQALNDCLLTDEELGEYRERVKELELRIQQAREQQKEAVA